VTERPSVQPQLSVRRGRAAVEFYKRAFGAVELHRVGGDEANEAVVSQLQVAGGGRFWVADESPEHANFSPESADGRSTTRMLLVADDVDAAVARATAAGAVLIRLPADEHGWRIGRVLDPFGHHWEIARPLAAGRDWNLLPVLEGARVRLDPLERLHHDALLEAARPAEIWQWWEYDLSTGADAFDEWFEIALAANASGEEGHFATIELPSGIPVGSTSFCTPRPEARGIEIGWTWLTPAAWNRGINAEAKMLQLAYAFEQLDCIRVEFDTDELNERSRRAIKALGAQLDGIMRDWTIMRDGRRRSSALYSIVEGDWAGVRAGLKARIAAAGNRG
jgi:RimJ/RimL family protein N-acetyltransferase/uncharacterized glyoxalase superfamily protein PhnB